MKSSKRCAAALIAFLGSGIVASAHPHVQVSVRSVVVVDEAGEITAIRHAWKFDEAFSAFSTTGLDTDKDGKLSREELASLAQVNVESLSEYAFFTYLKKGKDSSEFSAVKDYHLAHDGKALTLHFTLPVEKKKLAIKEANTLGIPVIAILDTNTDPSGIAFPVPGNDDASRAIQLYCNAIADAILDGRQGGQARRGVDIGALDQPPVEEAALATA